MNYSYAFCTTNQINQFSMRINHFLFFSLDLFCCFLEMTSDNCFFCLDPMTLSLLLSARRILYKVLFICHWPIQRLLEMGCVHAGRCMHDSIYFSGTKESVVEREKERRVIQIFWFLSYFDRLIIFSQHK